MYKILIVGAGGREHALAWKFSQDHRVKQIFVAPGNAGTELSVKTENVALETVDELLQFALKEDIDLTIVGAEALLVEGIVDKFKEHKLTIFGPDQKAAQLEGSKVFAKEFMNKYGVKTAAHQSFTDSSLALDYLKTSAYPIVVKASGLAAGKGVIICQNQDEAEKAVKSIMQDKIFGNAGAEVVIEEYLEGFEVSILSFCDSKTILPMKSAKDHKTIGENNTGPNTGGMGSICPHPQMTEEQYQLFLKDILQPTLTGIKEEKMDFAGFIFFGLMVNEKGVYLLEYNMRMGDPETQAVLMLMETPLLEPITAALEKNLEAVRLEWQKGYALCLVAASKGYPEKYQKGMVITGLEQARFFSQIFIAGARKKYNNIMETCGGRVLNVVCQGDDLETARKKAYNAIKMINFDGITYRKDIGAVSS